jgi:hypothetical protein
MGVDPAPLSDPVSWRFQQFSKLLTAPDDGLNAPPQGPVCGRLSSGGVMGLPGSIVRW